MRRVLQQLMVAFAVTGVSCGRRANVSPVDESKAPASADRTPVGEVRDEPDAKPVVATKGTETQSAKSSEDKPEVKAELTQESTGSTAAASDPVPDEKPSKPEPQTPNADSVFVFLGDGAPVFFGVDVSISGRQIEEHWRVFLEDAFDHFDRDADGSWSSAEFPKVFLSQATGSEPSFEEFVEGDVETATKEAVVEALQNRRPQHSLAAGQVLDPRVARLHQYLDIDYDDLLSAEEFDAAEQTLAKFDFDSDELISIDELGGFSEAQPMMGMNDAGPFRSIPFTADDRSTRAMLRRYKLTLENFGIPPESFSPYDADDDGLIHGPELSQLMEKPPLHLLVGVHFAADSSQPAVTVKKSFADMEKVGAKLHQPNRNVLILEFSYYQIALRVNDFRAARSDEAFAGEFQLLDRNNNNYLEERELPPAGGTAFDELDSDGDGKVSAEEFAGVLRLLVRSAECRLQLGASLFGRSLFERLDGNRDQRLSRREMRQGKELIPRWDADEDNKLSAAELPRHYEVTLRLAPNNQFAGRLTRRVTETRLTKNNVEAPEWFAKMDVNNDGDVSRQEFLGSLEALANLDQNNDGVITPDEAKKYAE